MKTLFKKMIVSLLSLEARILLKRAKPKIVVVIGSVGKTSVKDATYSVLKDYVHTRKSQKSYNSEIGVPLSILGLPNAWSNPLKWLKNIIDGALYTIHPGKYPEVLVLEVGLDRPGDIERVAKWVKPDVVVLTRLPDVPVHVEFFESPEEVIDEKLKMLNALKPEGVLIYNQDDEKVVEVAEGVRQQTIGYSRYSLSPFTASGDNIVYENGKAAGFEFTLTHLDDAVVVRVEGSLGVQHAYNCAAAMAVGTLFDIDIKKASEALENHLPPPGRMRIIEGVKDSIIIDDTYNSSPTAAERALHTLAEIKGVQRKVAVLGDMMELGQYSVREHEKIGEQAAKIADVLITVGVRSRATATGALEFGLSEKNILQYEDSTRAGKELQNIIEPGDVLLIKGSQSMRMEKIVEEIMAKPEQAENLLVRQSRVWKEK